MKQLRRKWSKCFFCKEVKYDTERVKRLGNKPTCPDCLVIELYNIQRLEDDGGV